MPTEKLPFKSILVTSMNDPYITLERAKQLAIKWGSRLVNIGLKGHINSQSNLDEWKEGQELLSILIQSH